MPQIQERDRRRISARISIDVREALQQAADLLGATVTQFVVQTAYQEAQRIIDRKLVIRLTERDAKAVFALFDHPPKPTKRLKDAAKAYKGVVRV